MPKTKSTLRPAWLEVSRSALAYNCRNIKQKLGPQVELMAMVKANAYGHGAVECSQIFLKNGASALGVAIIEEGIELRQAGIKAPVLVAYPEMPGREDLALKHDLDLTICDLGFARSLSKLARKKRKTVNVYVKLDTGMGRYGISSEEGLDFAKQLAILPALKIKGIMTHLSSAFAKDKTFTNHQLKLFRNVVSELERAGITIPIKSIANSSAILDMPESYFNQARAGVLLYGIYPSAENSRSVPVRPAARLAARVAFIKHVPAGTPISYMRTYHTEETSTIATIPLGYCDGYSFALSNRGTALLKGKEVPVVGRVCMDSLMLDVSAIPDVRIREEVVFFGSQNGEQLSLEDVAQKAGTIPYEIISRVSRRVPIVYTK